MEQSKKITNNELLEFFNKKFNDMGKNFDKKLDLMLATPIMQKEIDHDALNNWYSFK